MVIHLTKEENEAVIAARPISDCQETKKSLILVGTLLTLRPFNTFALEATMKGAWGARKGFIFHELQSNLFIFEFAEEGDLIRVLSGGPWAFEKSLLVLREPGLEQPSTMRFDSVDFWLRFYDVPVDLMNKDMATKLGEAVGKVKDIDDDNGSLLCGRFLRVRVSVNLNKPLRRGVMISWERDRMWVDIKYEKLPNFCYTCGKLGHVDVDCEDDIARRLQNEYGDWLRASPMKQSDRSGVEKERDNAMWTTMLSNDKNSSTLQSSEATNGRRSLLCLLVGPLMCFCSWGCYLEKKKKK